MKTNKSAPIEKRETSAERWTREAKEKQHKQEVERARHDPSEIEFREKRREIFAAASFVAPDEFPLELVASVAARIWDGKNNSEAVERAIGLLQECKDTITENKAKKERYSVEARRSMDLNADLDAPPGAFKIPFRHAISRITGQGRADRAEADYLAFLAFTNLGRTPEERNKTLKLQAGGIDAFDVQILAKSFAVLNAEGKISKDAQSKKTQKKDLMAKRDRGSGNHGKKGAISASSFAKKAKSSAKRSKRTDKH